MQGADSRYLYVEALAIIETALSV